MPSLFQGYVLMSILYYGMIFGIIFQINIFFTNIFKNKIVKFIIDFIFAVIGGIIFWVGIFRSNLGIFRIFLLIIYIAGFEIINFCLKDLVANISNKLYNVFDEKTKYKKIKEKNH